jgi:hypothetical protein
MLPHPGAFVVWKSAGLTMKIGGAAQQQVDVGFASAGVSLPPACMS